MSSHVSAGALSRRVILSGTLGLAFAPRIALALPAPRILRFEALRNGKSIGQQQTSLEPDGAGLVVRTTAEFAVKVGPLTLYHYRHQAVERWEGERFTSLDTHTDQNGKMLQVSARRGAGGVQIVDATGARISAPADAVPFSHWNREIAGRPLFNPQDGKLLHEAASPGEPSRVLAADGRSLPATRIVFRGDAYIEDYYDQSGTWVGLIGKLKDGSRLEYRRL